MPSSVTLTIMTHGFGAAPVYDEAVIVLNNYESFFFLYEMILIILKTH